jgi:hypothetical protein
MILVDNRSYHSAKPFDSWVLSFVVEVIES